MLVALGPKHIIACIDAGAIGERDDVMNGPVGGIDLPVGGVELDEAGAVGGQPIAGEDDRIARRGAQPVEVLDSVAIGFAGGEGERVIAVAAIYDIDAGAAV